MDVFGVLTESSLLGSPDYGFAVGCGRRYFFRIGLSSPSLRFLLLAGSYYRHGGCGFLLRLWRFSFLATPATRRLGRICLLKG